MSDIYELNCPFCDKLYKLPRDKVVKHGGKAIHCRKCGQAFSIPILPTVDPEVAEKEPVPIAAPAAEQEVAPASAADRDSASVESRAIPHAGGYAAEEGAQSDEVMEPPPLTEYTAERLDDGGVESGGDPLAAPEGSPAPHFTDEPAAYFAVKVTSVETYAAEGDGLDVPASEGLEASHEPLQDESATVSQAEPDGEAEREEPAIKSSWDVAEEDEPVAEPNEEEPAEVSLEAPPPLPPPPDVRAAQPLTPPSKPARAERVPVTPLLVEEEDDDEPVPRRRGRFGLGVGKTPPAQAVTPPVVEEVHAVVEPLKPPAEAVEEREGQAVLEGLGEPDARTAGADDAGTTTPAEASMREDPPGILAPEHRPVSIPPNILEVWLAMRRSLMLLAVMSVVIAVVLIAILLAILGIIPKK